MDLQMQKICSHHVYMLLPTKSTLNFSALRPRNIYWLRSWELQLVQFTHSCFLSHFLYVILFFGDTLHKVYSSIWVETRYTSINISAQCLQKTQKNRLKTIERWWLKPSSLKLCIYYEVINKGCWQTQSLHKSSNYLPHRVPSIQDWAAKWRRHAIYYYIELLDYCWQQKFS